MFISDKFIYIQMQKTGCTHIAKLLAKIFDGEKLGTHNPALKRQINSDLFFISSIRNPWDWYLSLWAYGVQGRGGVMSRLTKKNRLRALKNDPKGYNKKEIINKLTNKASLWTDVYQDSSDIAAFRRWLKMILDPTNAELIGEGYGEKQISKYCGFMTYRYLKLCCSGFVDLKFTDSGLDECDLFSIDDENCYIDFFIRQESLEKDLCAVSEKIRPLTTKERQLIWSAKKTNTSVRPHRLAQYYNEETIDLVAKRDRLLVEKFAYEFPSNK